MRKNRHITDLKYNTKRRIKSLKRSVAGISCQWDEVDFFIVSRCEEILDKLDEIEAEINGVDVSTH